MPRVRTASHAPPLFLTLSGFQTFLRFNVTFWLPRVVYPTTRVLAQTLSNLVTSNPPLLSHVWATYMALPAEQAILMYACLHL